MTLPLSSYNPDTDETPKKIDLTGLIHCPTCRQELKKKVNRDEIWKVVQVFKMVSWLDPNDKGWDKMFYPRYCKPAKELIEFMGSWRWAADCVQDVYERLKELGRTVTFETIAKHSAQWKMDKLEREAKGETGIKII